MAKLAQDGSQEARNYAKLTLVMFMEQSPEDYERALRKNLTQNTMRNLEKILEALKSGGVKSGGLSRTSRGSSFRMRSRRAHSRKTL